MSPFLTCSLDYQDLVPSRFEYRFGVETYRGMMQRTRDMSWTASRASIPPQRVTHVTRRVERRHGAGTASR